MLLGVGIDADDRKIAVDAPCAELGEEPRADRQHDVGLAPQLAAERQCHAQRIAAVEHAAAAAIAEHRRLQHGGQRGDFFGRILRAAAANDHRPFRRAEPLRRAPDRVGVDLAARGIGSGACSGRRRRIGPRHRSRIRAPPARAGRCASRAAPARSRAPLVPACGCSADMIDQPLDDAGLVADFVQMAEAAADIGVGNLPDQRQHRRVHGIGGEEGGRGIEEAGSGNDGIGLRLSGRERRAERHIGGALLMAGVDGAQPVGELEQRLEQQIVLHARQRIDRVEPVGDQRGDDRFAVVMSAALSPALFGFLRWHALLPCAVECADRRGVCRGSNPAVCGEPKRAAGGRLTNRRLPCGCAPPFTADWRN